MSEDLNPRFATLKRLRETLIRAYLSPPPSIDVLRDWADKARIARIKCNQSAKAGGGTVYYSVGGWEKFLKSKVMPGPTRELLAK